MLNALIMIEPPVDAPALHLLLPLLLVDLFHRKSVASSSLSDIFKLAPRGKKKYSSPLVCILKDVIRGDGSGEFEAADFEPGHLISSSAYKAKARHFYVKVRCNTTTITYDSLSITCIAIWYEFEESVS